MDGIHDLGGMEGFGPVPVEAGARSFRHDWEARAMSLFLLMEAWGAWPPDAGRHAIEKLPPADYLAFGYYEKWLAAMVNLAAGAGLLSRAEVASGRPDPGAARRTPPIDAPGMAALCREGTPFLRPLDRAPAFAAGDRVRTARHGHSGHTRLPRYLRDRIGEVVLHHGAHVLPDAGAVRMQPPPEHLYTVRFRATDLWGPQADPSLTVGADLWETYLDRAD